MKSSLKLKFSELTLLAFFAVACSSASKAEQSLNQHQVAEEHQLESNHGHDEPKLAVVPAKTEHASPQEHHKIQGTDPEKAFDWLKNGNTRFVKQSLRKDGQGPKDIKRLSEGQKPHSIVLSCSDSRVPPELIFDQKLGEIFVVRTAGQSLDPVALASIEYAVEHLGANNIVVLGHTKCGAVTAAHSTLHGEDAGSANLNHLVKDIHPRISNFKDKKPSKDYSEESWANVDGVAADLLKRSAILEQKATHGAIKVRRGLYDLHSGKVDFK